MHPEPDYSAAYVVLHTDSDDGLEGHGLTFTNGRGNEVCVAAIRRSSRSSSAARSRRSPATCAASGASLASDSQLRWLGPEKGVIHLATAAVVNAVWDLWAKREGKPLWKLLARPAARGARRRVDFRYIDGRPLARGGARAPARGARAASAEREREIARDGYPAYTTSAGWLGYDDEKVEALVARGDRAMGSTHVKMKVGARHRRRRSPGRARSARRSARTGVLMMDANQVWGVDEAIACDAAPARVRSLVDRGADEPGRRPRPRAHPAGDRPDPRRDR